MVNKNHGYRIKKMNMIEVLALQSQITFKDITSTEAVKAIKTEYSEQLAKRKEAREKINELEVK